MQKTHIAMIASSLHLSGITTMIVNLACALDPAQYDIDIIGGSPVGISVDGHSNIRIIELPAKEHKFAHLRALNELFGHSKYDIVHVHGQSTLMAPELILAGLHHVPVRIAHSHNTTCGNLALHRLMRPIFDRSYDAALACGNEAGKWLFGFRPFTVIPNGFNLSRFAFNADQREAVRNELSLADAFLIGHTGRMNTQKNQSYLISIFEKIAEKEPSARLLLAGTGPDMDKIRRQVSDSRYSDRIILCGEVQDTSRLYSAMDIFVLPSLYEGMCVSALEAQVNGLPCLMSSTIPWETAINRNVCFMALEAGTERWADQIIRMREDRIDTDLSAFAEHDINHAAAVLADTYNRLLRGADDNMQ